MAGGRLLPKCLDPVIVKLDFLASEPVDRLSLGLGFKNMGHTCVCVCVCV